MVVTAILSGFLGVKNSPPTPTPTVTTEVIQTNSSDLKTEVKQTLTPTQTKTTGSDLNYLMYPSAKILTEQENTLNMETSDAPDKVTGYYKSKIEGFRPKSKAYAQTSTNGQILNKLAYSSDGHQITIEVKSLSSSSGSGIIISRD